MLIKPSYHSIKYVIRILRLNTISFSLAVWEPLWQGRGHLVLQTHVDLNVLVNYFAPPCMLSGANSILGRNRTEKFCTK